jgi:hypothetical protein
MRLFLKRLSQHKKATKPLRTFVKINPLVDLGNLSPEALVSFVPMDAVDNSSTGIVRLSSKPLRDVQKGYMMNVNYYYRSTTIIFPVFNYRISIRTVA